MHQTTMAFPVYNQYSTVELVRAYAAGPVGLRTVVEGLDDEALRARPRGPLTWSIAEILLHVTDSEIQAAFRIRKACAEPGAAWPSYDQDVWTRQLRHREARAAQRDASLDLFAALRRATLPYFECAEPADWERMNGIHAEFGAMTLRNLLELYADHSERHIQQILGIRERLGVPIAYSLLLPQRLF